MIVGEDLARAIEEMGLNPNSFAKLAGVSQTAILNLIRTPKVQPKPATAAAVEHVLSKSCRCCGQYTEKPDAWNHSATNPENGGRKRKR